MFENGAKTGTEIWPINNSIKQIVQFNSTYYLKCWFH